MKNLRNILLFCLLVILSCTKTLKIEDGFIEIDEASIYYKTIGEGEPILFVHGGPGLDHKIFTPYIDELGSDFQVIYYDQRGTGCDGRAELD